MGGTACPVGVTLSPAAAAAAAAAANTASLHDTDAAFTLSARSDRSATRARCECSHHCPLLLLLLLLFFTLLVNSQGMKKNYAMQYKKVQKIKLE